MIETFPFLTPDDVGLIEGRARRTTYQPSERIVAEGERRKTIFIVRTGSARVERDHLGYPVSVATLGPGELIGEMSFVDHSAASASVVAAERSDVDVIELADVELLLAADPALASRFYHSLAVTLARRLRATSGLVTLPYGDG